MGRRHWAAVINRAAGEHERYQRSRAREKARLVRVLAEQDRQNYLNSREVEAAELNRGVESRLVELGTLLISALNRSSDVDLKLLYRRLDAPELESGQSRLALNDLLRDPLGFIVALFKRSVAKRDVATESDRAAAEVGAQALLVQKAEIEDHNRQIDAFALAVKNAEPEAMVAYAEMIIKQSPYPEGFPKNTKVGIIPESQQLVIEYELPQLSDIIPEQDQFRYVKSSDKIAGKSRPDKKRSAEYLNVIAQVTIRSLHELFTAQGLTPVQVLAFSGYVNSIDSGTGRKVTPHLISVRVSRDEFSSLLLRNVEPIACLKRMGASVSSGPAELKSVRPIVEFSMVDPRFVEEQDVLTALDQRPNLMELTPSEFESLITNLFQKMGLESRQTQASRDGGVDCVAYDNRPVLGGKVVIQAKRYKNTVGVSAVRDLFGTLHNEGASKGILVTTSGFGSASTEFANGKPIELIAGGQLLYLLKEHAGIEAKILPPVDWVDWEGDGD